MKPEQYDALAAKLNTTGFSANPRRGGGAPRNRFMVGQRDVPEDIHPSPSSGENIRSYHQANAPTLSRTDRFLGGWSYGGHGYLDVPKGFPTTPAGETAARHSTLANSQIAYGAMNKRGKYAGDRSNPYHSENRFEVQAHDTPEQRETWARMPERTGVTSMQFSGVRHRGRTPAQGVSFS